MLKILLSNDDGVQADGINSLREYLQLKYDVTTIAPLEERSTTGHSLSLDKPLRIEKLNEKIYGCSGYPGDCVLVGLGHVLKDHRPDVVISGINRGANLGQDLYYSGTIAAAREAAFHRVPSLALSLVLKSPITEYHYQSGAIVTDWLLSEGIHLLIPPLSLININIPNRPLKEIKGIKYSNIGFRIYSEEVNERIDSRGRPYYWIAGLYEGFYPDPQTDCAVVEDGYISLTIHKLVSHSSINETEIIKVIERTNAKYF